MNSIAINNNGKQWQTWQVIIKFNERLWVCFHLYLNNILLANIYAAVFGVFNYSIIKYET